MKVVYDTCLYIDFLRSSDRLPLFRDRSYIRFLSPIVMMELMAGARTPHSRKILDQLFHPYSQARRIISLGPPLYYKAGQCLAKVGSFHHGLSHDILIAHSAASVGAVLFTSNRKDFEKISKLVSMRVEYV